MNVESYDGAAQTAGVKGATLAGAAAGGGILGTAAGAVVGGGIGREGAKPK